MNKILIVDDQYGIRVLLNEMLKKDGYEVYLAANGIQALEMLEQKEPELLLLDMKIPGMDGLEILREREKRSIAESTKVIMMTAYGELNMIEDAKALGAVSYFSKPFDIDDVRQEIKRQLETTS
ncbi:response regulator [Alteribacillus sp. HJP-4]|uniref:response regulator n=1 Tax=Alteribacillus sp. HJP-4 TaxID=2775394 RepID=UPI0035CD2A28